MDDSSYYMEPFHLLQPSSTRNPPIARSAAVGIPSLVAPLLRRLADPNRSSPAALSFLAEEVLRRGPGWARLVLPALLEWLAAPCVALQDAYRPHDAVIGSDSLQRTAAPSLQAQPYAWHSSDGEKAGTACTAATRGIGFVGNATDPDGTGGIGVGGDPCSGGLTGRSAPGPARDGCGRGLGLRPRLLGLPPPLLRPLRQLLAALPRCAPLYGSLDEHARQILRQLLAALPPDRVTRGPTAAHTLDSGVSTVCGRAGGGGGSGGGGGGGGGGGSHLGRAHAWVDAALRATRQGQARAQAQAQVRPPGHSALLTPPPRPPTALPTGAAPMAAGRRRAAPAADAHEAAGGAGAMHLERDADNDGACVAEWLGECPHLRAGAGARGAATGTASGTAGADHLAPAAAALGGLGGRDGMVAAPTTSDGVSGGAEWDWWWIPEGPGAGAGPLPAGPSVTTTDSTGSAPPGGAQTHSAGLTGADGRTASEPAAPATREDVSPTRRGSPGGSGDGDGADGDTGEGALGHGDGATAAAAAEAAAPAALRLPRRSGHDTGDGATPSRKRRRVDHAVEAGVQPPSPGAGGSAAACVAAARSPGADAAGRPNAGEPHGRPSAPQAWVELLHALQDVAAAGADATAQQSPACERLHSLLEHYAAAYGTAAAVAPSSDATAPPPPPLPPDSVLYVVRQLLTPQLGGGGARVLLAAAALPAVAAVERVMPKPLQQALAAAAALHPRPLTEAVLVPTARRSTLTAGQAQLLIKTAGAGAGGGAVKAGGAPLPLPLQALVLRAVASAAPGWTEQHVAVAQGLLDAAGEGLDAEALAALVDALAGAVQTGPAALRRSVPLCRLLLSLTTRHGGRLGGAALAALRQAAAATATFLTKPCVAKLAELAELAV